jgi:hypothetical protein
LNWQRQKLVNFAFQFQWKWMTRRKQIRWASRFYKLEKIISLLCWCLVCHLVWIFS